MKITFFFLYLLLSVKNNFNMLLFKLGVRMSFILFYIFTFIKVSYALQAALI